MTVTQASILIPTHDHHATLPMSVGTCLDQTVADIEVLVIGDGVDDRVREVALSLAEADARVRFLDLPKGPHHGEVHRDTAIRAATSNAIFYLCDDDLLLPRHVENLLPLLHEHDLVQCRNGYVDTGGRLVLFPTDLSDPDAVTWHLAEPPRNAISLTGTAHRRDTYLDLDEGWTTTPTGEWPDHYMWKKLLRREGVRAATHPEMTAVQLPTSTGRADVGQAERATELRWWADRLAQDDGHAWLQAQVAAVTPTQLDRTHRALVDATLELRSLRPQLREAQARARQAQEVSRDALARAREAEAASRATVAQARAAVARAERRVAQVEASRSWRVTAPLRRLGRLRRR